MSASRKLAYLAPGYIDLQRAEYRVECSRKHDIARSACGHRAGLVVGDGFLNNVLSDVEERELEGITVPLFLTPDGLLDYPITTASVNRSRTLGIEFRGRY